MLLRDGFLERKLTCAVCGSGLDHKRVGRIRKFCSDRCRDEARRDRNFVGAFGSPAIEVARAHETTKNPADRSAVCGGQKRGRGSILSPTDWPIDLIGGCRRGSELDPELARKIIEIECSGPLKGFRR
jgi:hypothetical protein